MMVMLICYLLWRVETLSDMSIPAHLTPNCQPEQQSYHFVTQIFCQSFQGSRANLLCG